MNNVIPGWMVREMLEKPKLEIVNAPEFPKFPSIPRLMRECTVTEKLDGTNGLVHVADDMTVRAGSRNRWLDPDGGTQADNFGFAKWVREHSEQLALGLGPGHHYGEWWGAGVGRRYGMSEKRFSLFNTAKHPVQPDEFDRPTVAGCCYVVPILYVGDFDTLMIMSVVDELRQRGSRAAPGFMNPEGVRVFHHHAQRYFKYTLGGDGHKTARIVAPEPALPHLPNVVEDHVSQAA